MKKYSFYLLFIGGLLSAQNTYIDPTTTLALKNYADVIEEGQEKTNKEQKNCDRLNYG